MRINENGVYRDMMEEEISAYNAAKEEEEIEISAEERIADIEGAILELAAIVGGAK